MEVYKKLCKAMKCNEVMSRSMMRQVDELTGLQEERLKEIDSLGVQLRDALGRLDEEKER